jgi:hypothetical protein
MSGERRERRAAARFLFLDLRRGIGKHRRMKTKYISCLLLGLLTLGYSAMGADKEGQWVSLFNGKDLSGWVPVHDVTFEVKDSNLRLVKGMGWLRSEKEYQDFNLELEWRALDEQYDSGIFIRCIAEGKPWPDNGWQVNLKYSAIGNLVRGYKSVVPAETPKLPVNQWVKMRLEVRGKKVKLIVNGEDNWTFEELDRDRGYIGFQAENKAFDFRNIRIQELK